MKYLRKFNESFSDDLKSFCETYLVYLIDSGFKINITPKSWVNCVDTRRYYLYNLSITKDVLFSWNEIRDEFIPFYEVLKSNYNLLFIYDMDVAHTRDESWAIKIEMYDNASLKILGSSLNGIDSDSLIIQSIDIVIKKEVE